MKHYANLLPLALLAALLLAGCRSAAQHRTMLHHEQTDSLSEQLSYHAHGILSEQVQNQNDTESHHWKITWHFDTTQPPDSTTGLPPTQSLEIEGSETLQMQYSTKKTQAELVDSVQTSRHLMQELQTETHADEQREIDAGIDIGKGIKTGIVLFGIIAALAAIAIVFVIYKLCRNA